MPISKDTTMLKPNSKKVLIAMAEAELEPKELAAKSGVPVNTVYIVRRGYYVKPCHLGKIAKALNVKVVDLIADEQENRGQYSDDNTREAVICTAEP